MHWRGKNLYKIRSFGTLAQKMRRLVRIVWMASQMLCMNLRLFELQKLVDLLHWDCSRSGDIYLVMFPPSLSGKNSSSFCFTWAKLDTIMLWLRNFQEKEIDSTTSQAVPLWLPLKVYYTKHNYCVAPCHRVARFFLDQSTKTGKSIPNYHKIYQIAIKYFQWP
jgi:hypothetical protein